MIQLPRVSTLEQVCPPVKTLFYTSARVSELVNIKVEDLRLELEPPQIYLAVAKGGSDGYVPILPNLAQELRTHLSGRKAGYLFESNRHDCYSSRAIQLMVKCVRLLICPSALELCGH